MISKVKRMLRSIIRQSGFDIRRYQPQRLELGKSAVADIRHFLQGAQEPTIFDVGANLGQTAKQYAHAFPEAQIHSFEPSPSTFALLQANCSSYPKVACWNYGVGAQDGTLELLENDCSDMSSFLEPSAFSIGHVTKRTTANVVSLDSFAKQHDIHFIHLLKSDTQGFDFEVFKGAKQLMNSKQIGLIYFEFIFSDMYKHLPSFDQVFQYLTNKGFLLVSFYEFHFQKQLASWSDALFINRDYYNKTVERA